MTERLKNKVAIVVGAGSPGPGCGNGKATAVLFAREEAKVLCVDVNEAAETVAIIAANVTRSAKTEAMANQVAPIRPDGILRS